MFEFAWEKVYGFTPENTDKFVKKEKEGYILEVDVELHKNHNKLSFLVERMKMGKVGKLVPNLKNKETHIRHIKSLNEPLKQGFKFKKVHRVIRFEKSNE